MKWLLQTIVLSVVVIPLLAGCCAIPMWTVSTGGSGNVVTVEQATTGFDELDVSNAFQVDVGQGDDYRVVVRVDDNLEQYLQVVKQGSTLRIGLEPGRAYNLATATLEAEVSMPELAGMTLSGASRVTVTGFESTRSLEVDLSGASRLRGDIDSGKARFQVSGASQVALSGSAEDVTIDASGASRVDLSDFAVGDADVEASGASTVTIDPSGTLDAVASGASHVYYLGNPTLGDVDTSGASSVERD
jgi:hypothetical protein